MREPRKAPKSKRTSTSKQEKPKQQITLDDLSETQKQELIGQMIEKEIFDSLVINEAKLKKQVSAQELTSILSEYMNSYILLGYDSTDDEIAIFCERSLKDKRSNNELLRQVFIARVNEGIQGIQ